jgi:hypothetical protein
MMHFAGRISLRLVAGLCFAGGIAAAPAVAQSAGQSSGQSSGQSFDQNSGQSASAAKTPPAVSFSIGEQDFEIPVPAGYCQPTGERSVMSREVAAGDTQNFTLLDVDRCGTFGIDYILIKSPRELPSLPMPKETFIQMMAAQLQNNEVLSAGFEQANEDAANLTNGSLRVVPADYGFDGHDEHCVYLAGILKIAIDGQTDAVRSASCVTLVGTRNIVVHTYDFTGTPASIAELKSRARAIAMSIQPD